MLSLGTPDRRSWDRRVERHEAASLVNREGEQIKVGDLARPVNSVAIGDAGIQQADVIRPELMLVCGDRFAESFHDRPDLQRVGVVRVRHDSHTPVLRDRTRGPAVSSSRGEPAKGWRVHRMILVEQGDQNVHVEKRAYQKASSSRSLSICSLVTIPPRFGNGRNPCVGLGAGPADGGAVNARRVSSEMTAPAVFFSRRASSLAARSTSSSISRVVRTHLMLSHHIGGVNVIGITRHFSRTQRVQPARAALAP